MSRADTSVLSGALPGAVVELCAVLRDAGHRAWVVGGCVRDALLHGLAVESPAAAFAVHNDWDIATSARPEQVRRLFRHVVPTGIEHGTVLVMLGGVGYEVTTLRGEQGYSDGRRPDSVHFVDDIVEDLARRDFTINAIAFEPFEARLIDPFDGLGDLRARRLRAVGVALERFREDGLRVLRAARFLATLELHLDPDTERAMEPSLDSYRKVSAERIRDEWLKTMKARAPSRAFEVMKNHGLLALTAPELLESVGCEQNRHHAFDVWGHAMACLDAAPRDAGLRVAALLHDIGKPRSRAWSEKTGDYTFYEHERIGAEMVEPLLTRLRFSVEERTHITALVRHHLICYEPGWTDAAVRRWLRRVSPERVEALQALARADALAKGRDVTEELQRLEELRGRVEAILAAGAALSVRDLAIGGRDLMSVLGLRPGPSIGRILAALLEEVLEDPALNQREPLLERARQLLASTG